MGILRIFWEDFINIWNILGNTWNTSGISGILREYLKYLGNISGIFCEFLKYFNNISKNTRNTRNILVTLWKYFDSTRNIGRFKEYWE